MVDASLIVLTRDHGRRAPEATFAAVTDRVCRWLLAVDAAGLGQALDDAFDAVRQRDGRYRDTPRFPALRALIEPALRASAQPSAPSADFADLLHRLAVQFGVDLPPSLVGFWELRTRSPQWRALFDAVVSPEVLAPAAYLDHGFGSEYRLSIAATPKSLSMVHEKLEDEYVEWYDEEAVVPKATAETWRGLSIGNMVMLDPAVAYSLVKIGSDHGEWVELVGDWRDDTGESPIFRACDDDAYANLLGTTIPQWLSLEIDATLARLVAPDAADAVSLGAQLLSSA